MEKVNGSSKIVSALSIFNSPVSVTGQKRHFDTAGDLIYKVVFTDGSSSLVESLFAPSNGRQQQVAWLTKSACISYLGFPAIGSGINSANARIPYRTVANGACRDLQLAFANFAVEGAVCSIPTDVTLRATIEYPSGTFVPVLFSGASQVTIKSGDSLFSDVCPIVLPAGAQFYVRTFVHVSGSGTWPVMFNNGDDMTGANTEWGVNLSDKTGGGSINQSYGQWVFAPWSVLGIWQPGNRANSVAIIGDSISFGIGDGNATPEVQATISSTNSGSGGTYCVVGYWFRALKGANVPLQLLALPGDGCTGGHLTGTPSLRYWRFGLAARGATHVVVALGVNDLNSSAADLESAYVSVATELAGDGLKVYGATLTPVCTSSDKFTTFDNQTPGPNEAKRLAFNAWMRTTPSPLSGYFEVADAAESARDSGRWKTNGCPADGAYPNQAYTQDGVHPTTLGHITMARAIDVTLFR